jgi:hypothetical protein
MFPIKNFIKPGEALSPLIFRFALEYAIRRVQSNQKGIKLNGKHQLHFYAAADVDKRLKHTSYKENHRASMFAIEIRLEINAAKTKYTYVVMSRDHHAGQNYNT